MLERNKKSSRERIVSAAIEIAYEVGPARLSLDAVAARAGLSKGGLLYSFPTKAKLLEAVVAEYMKEHERAMEEQETHKRPDPNHSAQAFINVYRSRASGPPPASGVLAALVEDPDSIRPIRDYRRALLTRMLKNASDRDGVLITYLSLTALECSKLLDCDILTDEEQSEVLTRLEKILQAH